MGIRPAITGLTLGMTVLIALVYVPGRLENGVYIRPHFLPPAQAVAAPPALKALADAMAAGDASGKLPPLEPPAGGVARR